MFRPISQPAAQSDRPRPATNADARPQHRFHAPQTLDEAYEMCLLAEVARWDDHAAFEEIYARHRGAVAHVALQICRDAGAAEEIVQHAFTALWVRAGRLVAKSVRLRPWLTTVARNAAIDQIRAHRHAQPLSDAVAVPARTPSPEDIVLAGERSAELTQAIATLSAEQRAAIELIYFSAMSYQAAADALGEPLGTIKSRIRLAVGHLRKRLDPA